MKTLLHTSASSLLEPGLMLSQKQGPKPSHSGCSAASVHDFTWWRVTLVSNGVRGAGLTAPGLLAITSAQATFELNEKPEAGLNRLLLGKARPDCALRPGKRQNELLSGAL